RRGAAPDRRWSRRNAQGSLGKGDRHGRAAAQAVQSEEAGMSETGALPASRRAIEDVIERLISLLDLVDGDADCEDGADREHDPAEDGIADHHALDILMMERV